VTASLAAAAAIYATFMLFTGGAFAWSMARRDVVSASA
jgi:hypothetical protein